MFFIEEGRFSIMHNSFKGYVLNNSRFLATLTFFFHFDKPIEKSDHESTSLQKKKKKKAFAVLNLNLHKDRLFFKSLILTITTLPTKRFVSRRSRKLFGPAKLFFLSKVSKSKELSWYA